MERLTDFLTTGAAARELGVSAELVRMWIRTGRVEAVRTPLGHLISRHELERLREERRRAGRGGARADR